jgi:hypothetical protein
VISHDSRDLGGLLYNAFTGCRFPGKAVGVNLPGGGAASSAAAAAPAAKVCSSLRLSYFIQSIG